MATNQWKCAACKYIGPTSEFVTADGGYLCPKPESIHPQGREDVFPHRVFRCVMCAQEGTQDFFFGKDCSFDLDPFEKRWEAECMTCGRTAVEQIV